MLSNRLVVALALLSTVACRGTGEKAPESKAEPAAAPTPEGVVSRGISYTAGKTTLNGYIAWDATAKGKRPGVLLVHEWWGLNDNVREQARRLAKEGYVAFALDMYGAGKHTAHPDSAQAFMQAAMRDMVGMSHRFNAALQQLKQDPNVDSTRIAAIGYCFGGAVVLGMAQTGAPLRAVVSFHGAMPPVAKVPKGIVTAHILVLAGGADPMVPTSEVDAFAARMKKAGANIEVVKYPGVMHSFTDPDADKSGVKGLKYDAKADTASFQAMLKLFNEVLK